MEQQNKVFIVPTPEEVLAKIRAVVLPEGVTVEKCLIDSLKQANNTLKASRDNVTAYRMTNKSTGLLLTKLKAKRINADRNGGGAVTSRLTKEINVGRSIVNQSVLLLKEEIKMKDQVTQSRNALLDALRLFYIETSQG